MRKIIWGIVFGAFLALAANLVTAQSSDSAPPQGPPGGWHRGPMDPAREAAHLAKRLSLNSEQQTQVQALLTAQQTEHQALEKNQTITHQQFLAQTKAIHEQTEQKIEALLTDTQKTQFQEMKAHMHHGPPPPEGQEPPPPPQ